MYLRWAHEDSGVEMSTMKSECVGNNVLSGPVETMSGT